MKSRANPGEAETRATRGQSVSGERLRQNEPPAFSSQPLADSLCIGANAAKDNFARAGENTGSETAVCALGGASGRTADRDYWRFLRGCGAGMILLPTSATKIVEALPTSRLHVFLATPKDQGSRIKDQMVV